MIKSILMDMNPFFKAHLFFKKTFRVFLIISCPLYAQNPGEMAVPFTATTLEGDSIRLADFKGEIVILDFWASWCAPCLKEMPFLIEIQEKYRDQNLVVIAINLDNNKKNAVRFLKKIGKDIPFPIIFDKNKELPKLYIPAAMPTTIFIDTKGAIRYRHNGFKESDKSSFITEIEKLVKEK